MTRSRFASHIALIFILLGCAKGPSSASASPATGGEPDYSVWASLLSKYYDPAKGMDYRGLKAKDAKTLSALRSAMARVNPAKLDPNQRLAYWINLYNISVVGVVVDKYPVKSIRDISTDPVVRLNVFKKPYVAFGSGKMSLNDIENVKIREAFKDPRIHFAINCAAKSCPPIRPEPYTGAKLQAQLDDQARRFLNGPLGIRLGSRGDTLVIHTTKIMDWFKDDFVKWGGGSLPFLRKYLSPKRQQILDGAKKTEVEYDDYSWELNLWQK